MVLYGELENLSAYLMEMNINQLENKISKEDAKIILLEIADRQIDLQVEIFKIKKSLGLAKTTEQGNEKIFDGQ